MTQLNYIESVEDYDAFLDGQTYFDDNTTFESPHTGVYKGAEEIMEYFMLLNPTMMGWGEYVRLVPSSQGINRYMKPEILTANETTLEFKSSAAFRSFGENVIV